MKTIVRWSAVLIGTISIVVSIGLFLQMPWAIQVWPFPSGQLSNIFISSILAAIGAPIVWIGLSGETRAAAGGALNLLVTNLGFAVVAFTFFGRDRQSPVLFFGILSLGMVLLCGGLLIFSHRTRFTDSRPIPSLVRISFVVFAGTLLVTAIALLGRRPNVFPWPLSDENSVMYGWIFLGAILYFVYAVVYPVWGNARGQLIGFLAYDLVLIVPFLAHFRVVAPEMLNSLIIYTTVVSCSGLLAVYFLLVHPTTRFTFTRKSETPPAP
ncbi:MAG TPA: hypothetical protein VI729_04865 [Anaerolineales bacterium]|nr:hypothetical protein [Anaerolineales bacterium]